MLVNDSSLRRFASVLALGALLAISACAKREPLPGDSVAQDGAVAIAPPRATSAAPREPLGAVESRLFSPELLMEHQGELGIDDKQRDSIVAEVQKTQAQIEQMEEALARKAVARM